MPARHNGAPNHVQPLVTDHGASIAIVNPKGTVLAVIPPLNDNEGPDWKTAKRKPYDVRNAYQMAYASRMQHLLARSVRALRGPGRSLKAEELAAEIEKTLGEINSGTYL